MATEGENQFADTDILIEIEHLANFSLHAQNLGKAKEVLTSLNVMRKYIYNFPEQTLCLKKRPFDLVSVDRSAQENQRDITQSR